MDDPTFAVDLGGGVYLDAEGKLISGAKDIPVLYSPPGGFDHDPKSIRDAIKDFGGAMPDLTDQKSIDKFKKYGLSEELVKVLGKLGEVAGVVAGVATGAVLLLGVARMFGLLNAGPDAVSTLIKTEFDELDRKLNSLEKKWDARAALQWRSNMESNLILVQSYLAEIQKTTPDSNQLQALLTDIRNRTGNAFQDLNAMTTAGMWETTYPASQYDSTWPWLSAYGLLKHEVQGAPPTDATTPADGSLRFDHRIPVPLALYATSTFLTMLRAAVPEFRSLGFYREQLRAIARNIDGIAARMRNESLARTIYSPDHTRDTRHATSGLSTAPFPWGGGTRFPVGALDLCHYTNNFFSTAITKQLEAKTFPSRIATFQMAWPSPAKTLPSGPINVGSERTIENPEEVADAANAQSDIDYAELLVSSGYTALILRAALLRYLASDPPYSETVSGGARTQRDFVAEAQGKAKSRDIFLTGIIERPATVKSYNAIGLASITTQPAGKPQPLKYRIVARTLYSRSGSHGWHDPSYRGQVWRTTYENDPQDPSFKVMKAEVNTNTVVDEVELLSAQTAPASTTPATGSRSIKANTFDWYVPVPSPFSGLNDVATEAITKAKSLGWIGNTPEARAAQVLSEQTANFSLVDLNNLNFDAQSAAQTGQSQLLMQSMGVRGGARSGLEDLVTDRIDNDLVVSGWTLQNGQRRHVKEESVPLSWDVNWTGDSLRVALQVPASARNFEVFIVVEEELHSGEKIHSSYRVEMNTQITLVSEEFFDAEEQAINRANDVLREFSRKYVEVAPVGPDDPVISQIRPGDLIAPALNMDAEVDMRTQALAEAAQRHRPELLLEAIESVNGRALSMAGQRQQEEGPTG